MKVITYLLAYLSPALTFMGSVAIDLFALKLPDDHASENLQHVLMTFTGMLRWISFFQFCIAGFVCYVVYILKPQNQKSK